MTAHATVNIHGLTVGDVAAKDLTNVGHPLRTLELGRIVVVFIGQDPESAAAMDKLAKDAAELAAWARSGEQR